MKSCCFAGEEDQYVLSGSDDFNLYMWQIPPSENKGWLLLMLPYYPVIAMYENFGVLNSSMHRSSFGFLVTG
jgi:hypothetical protein